jgi:hypothetical protein
MKVQVQIDTAKPFLARSENVENNKNNTTKQ